MNFNAEQYFRAATERMRQARLLYHSGDSYALGMYCSGLAVECLLRAFRWQRDPTFSGRHDLDDLLKASELLVINDAQMRLRNIPEDEIRDYASALRAAMIEVKALWHNNLRFASEDRLRSHLHQMGRLHGIRGNAVKKNALDLLEAAQKIIDRGVALWTSKKR